ncbi:Exodeoxyribonuclease I subunit D [Carnobacterium iners]|uniref:Nuclease SbcCD subunit D n=1 Tax=Carnobacterium iners TaxID=1073423 RepID=A0A1X7NTY9_9LACT|nr:exonuclease SbcCD subunit D [Carnobacterium iners]SEK89419.1 Exodeoxyribonuclease I subunit D [Carnobacterium iners]SMH40885.1 Exodeoxyribonuclease I subunit D [Carnobacterium iners]
MRILHTADWHIGKIVNEVSMLEDQEFFLEQLIEKLKNLDVDVLIMAGDLYDRAFPPKEAVTLVNTVLTRLIKEINIPVFIIAGNHDSNERVEYGASLFESSNLYIEGTVKEETRKVTIQDTNFYLLPFADHVYIRELLKDDSIKNLEDATRAQINKIKETMNKEETNIIIAHGFVINISEDSFETTDSERPLSIGTAEYVNVEMFEDFDYVALGHLHKPQKVKHDRIRYSGSILKYSKSETKQKKQVSLVTVEKGSVEIEPIYLKPLHDMRVVKGSFENLMTQKSDDYVFFELLDETFIMDAMNQLRRRFPNAMGLDYITKKNDNQVYQTGSQKSLKETPLEDLFSKFYQQVKQKELAADQKEIVESILHKLGGNNK